MVDSVSLVIAFEAMLCRDAWLLKHHRAPSASKSMRQSTSAASMSAVANFCLNVSG